MGATGDDYVNGLRIVCRRVVRGLELNGYRELCCCYLLIVYGYNPIQCDRGKGFVCAVKDLLDRVRVVEAVVNHSRDVHTADPCACIGTDLKDRVGYVPSAAAKLEVEVG